MVYRKRNKDEPIPSTRRGQNYFKTAEDGFEELNKRYNDFDDYPPPETDSLGRRKPVNQDDRAKMLQLSREVWDIYSGTPRARAKRWQNQENYRRNVAIGGGTTMRITVPTLNLSHLDKAIHRFSQLTEELQAIKSLEMGKRTNSRTQLMLMRSAVYNCHTRLKFDADGYKGTVTEDFEPQRGD